MGGRQGAVRGYLGTMPTGVLAEGVRECRQVLHYNKKEQTKNKNLLGLQIMRRCVSLLCATRRPGLAS